jgi:hypothetical protein
MRVFSRSLRSITPGSALEGFPTLTLPRGEVLYRCHLRGVDPWFFAKTPGLRMNLAGGRGTNYLGRDIETAVHFAVGRAAGGMHVIMEDQADQLVITEFSLARAYRLADFLHPDAANFNATKSLVAKNEAIVWGQALVDAGFDGAVFQSQFTNSPAGNAVALFGEEQYVPMKADPTRTYTPREADVVWQGAVSEIPAPHAHVFPMTGREAALLSGYRVLPRQTRSMLSLV